MSLPIFCSLSVPFLVILPFHCLFSSSCLHFQCPIQSFVQIVKELRNTCRIFKWVLSVLQHSGLGVDIFIF
jgi:hypothetical protein